MTDAGLIAAVVIFFALALVYASGCAALLVRRVEQPEERGGGTEP